MYHSLFVPSTLPPTYITMKYIVSLFIAFLSVFFGLTSCNSKEDICHIGVSQCNNDKWRQQMNYEMKREAAFYERMVYFDFYSANDDSDLQIRQIDSLIDKGIDILVVSPNDAEKLTPVIEKVWNLGIPVIVVHQKILSNNYSAYIGADNQELGRDAAALIASTLQGKGKVVEMMGRNGYSTAEERHKGFMKKLAQYPQIEVAASANFSLDGEDIDHFIDSIYNSGTKLDAIFAHFNHTGLRAYDAVKRHHGDVKIVGIDGSMGRTGGLRNVENGKLMASFVYPSGGAEVVHTIAHIIEDEPYDWEIILHTAMITNENKQTFRMQVDQLKEREEKLDLLDVKFDHLLSRSSMQHMLLISSGIIILLIGLALVTGLRSYYLIIRHNEKLNAQKLKLEEQRDQLVRLSKELKESTRSKLQFFTQVSHEFRTPLTLIIAPTEELERSKTMLPEERKLLGIIHTNANILLRLINQSLDFRKMETGNLKLNLQYINMCESIKIWCDSFKALAQKRMIRYNFICIPISDSKLPAMGWLDAGKMESIIYNLLSNAMKFTPEGGKVTVSTSHKIDATNHRTLVLVIEDTGKGIPEDKIEYIFDLFYQTEVSDAGSGIGLATTKAYVELHGGTIRVESSVGQGSRFIIEIPYEADANAQSQWNAHNDEMEIAEENEMLERKRQEGLLTNDHISSKVRRKIEQSEDYNDIPMEHPDEYHEASKVISELKQVVNVTTESPSKELILSEESPSEIAIQQAEDEAVVHNELPQKPAILDDGTQYTVLVIDDNKDMRTYIKVILQEEFNVVEAENGKEGIAKALQIIPDAIVCDLLMPEMDGWECCKRLKAEWQTSHIPIMILTACTLEEQRMKCFECGADSFLNKPFNREIFHIRVRTLIANKLRMKAFYGDKTALPSADVNDLDKGFTERFRTVIENNLNDPSLSVETIATEMGMGRSQLYRKVKSLTGFTPIEMIRVARLKKAAEILKRTDMSVSEVAYEVGFSSPGYFTKCFSDYFGTSPSNYTKESLAEID